MPRQTVLEPSRTELNRISTFEELARIGIRHINSMPDELSMVCGPFSTGRLSLQENEVRFNAAVMWLKTVHPGTLFDQLPYETAIKRLASIWNMQGGQGYCDPILSVFYAAIFAQNKLRRAYFIPGWEHSQGATWEHDKLLQSNGVDILYLTEGALKHALEYYNQPEHMDRVALEA